MNPITIPNITIPVIGLPTIGIPSVGFPSASGGGLVWPAGLKESIKAIYDPAKQGMTNYDVIEAYAEDFTTWTVNKEGVIVNVTSKSITITNVLNSNPLIYAYGTFSVRLKIDGLKDGQGIFFGDNKEYTISENGIYDIDTTENIRTNFIGECNITITQLPTSILKDLSGNGNHAYLYGGKGKLNSGMGVYKVDYTTYNNSGNQNVTDIKPNSFVLLAGALSRLGLPYSSIIGEYIPSYAIRIQGISGGTITYYYRNENGKQLTYVIDADGDYILPPCYSEGAEGTAVNIVSNNNINNVTITQIPDYPNQLCYDGKMYAVCYGFPILEDYTVMAERTWFELTANSAFISKAKTSNNGAFLFELYQEREHVLSFGQYNDVSFKDGVITYQTKNTYNGTNIQSGTSSDENVLYIGKIRDNTTAGFNGCHGKIIIADRSFTADEITWLKDNWKKI